MPDMLEIHLYPPEATCSLCGADTPYRWGVPTHNGDLVSNAFGSWQGSQAVCQECHDAHAAGKIECFDHCYTGGRPLPFSYTLVEWRRRRFLEHRANVHLIVRG